MVGRVNTGGGIKFANVSEMIGTAKSNILKNDMVYVKRKYLNTDGGQATLDIIPTDVQSCEFSPDGKYLIICTYYTPFIHIYKINKTTNTFTKLPNPSTIPTISMGIFIAGNLVFSADSKYVCRAQNSAPYFNIYKIDSFTDTFTILPNVDIYPTETSIKNIALSADGTYLAVLTVSYITLYKRTGTQFNKLYQYSVTHPYGGTSGQYGCIHIIDNMIITSCGYNDVLTYTDTAITLVNSLTLNGINVMKTYVSDDGNINICGSSGNSTPPTVTQRISAYTADDNNAAFGRADVTFDNTMPTNVAGSVLVGALGGKIIAMGNGPYSPYLYVWYKDGTIYKKLSYPAPTGSPSGNYPMAMSHDGKYIAYGNVVYILVYTDEIYKAYGFYDASKTGVIGIGYAKTAASIGGSLTAEIMLS